MGWAMWTNQPGRSAARPGLLRVVEGKDVDRGRDRALPHRHLHGVPHLGLVRPEHRDPDLAVPRAVRGAGEHPHVLAALGHRGTVFGKLAGPTDSPRYGKIGIAGCPW